METIPIVLVWLREAEVPASEDASASCYDFAKNIRVFTMIVAELKLCKVKRQVLRANVVISANHAAF
jgi:hypothetical protein